MCEINIVYGLPVLTEASNVRLHIDMHINVKNEVVGTEALDG